MMKIALALGLLAIPLLGFASKDEDNILFNEGDWSAYRGDRTISLITNSKEMIGLLAGCRDESDECSWMIVAIPDICQPGSKFPALVHGATGGFATQLTCNSNDSEASTFVIDDFNTVTDIVKASDFIQIAVPVEGRIDVIEFPTKGYVKAAVKFDRVLRELGAGKE